MDQLDSTSQLTYNGIEFAFVQVVYYSGAPDIRIDGALYDIYGYQEFRRDKSRPYSRLELIPNGGRIVVLVGQWYEAAEVNQQGGAALGSTNTAANELDSGPVGVPAGAASTLIIPANNGRVRGVTVQNVGLTVIAVSKDPGLLQNLTKGAFLLKADSAANAGNGGFVTFDGWLGPVYAVNVVGGPGSVLVSSF